MEDEEGSLSRAYLGSVSCSPMMPRRCSLVLYYPTTLTSAFDTAKDYKNILEIGGVAVPASDTPSSPIPRYFQYHGFTARSVTLNAGCVVCRELVQVLHRHHRTPPVREDFRESSKVLWSCGASASQNQDDASKWCIRSKLYQSIYSLLLLERTTFKLKALTI